MKVKLFLILVFTVSTFFSGYTQKTKWKLNNTLNYKEEFFVLDTNLSIKHGTYIKYSPLYGLKARLMETGQYDMGKKDSVWIFFHNNHVIEYRTLKRDTLHGIYYTCYPDTSRTKIASKLFNHQGKRFSTLQLNLRDDSLRLKITGAYENGIKIGEWTYYYPNGEVFFRYDYTEGVILQNDDDTEDSYSDDGPVYLGGGNQGVMLELIPQLYGYYMDFNGIINLYSGGKDKIELISWLAEFIETYYNSRLSILFIIDASGDLLNIEITESPFGRMKQKRIAKKLRLSEKWKVKNNNPDAVYTQQLDLIIRGKDNTMVLKKIK
ncbi:MAG TPA: hypothetical protein VK982_02905 [Bacteroidales bacterium]|nr:hypothetical protein [Bacteroidales bacterium]